VSKKFQGVNTPVGGVNNFLPIPIFRRTCRCPVGGATLEGSPVDLKGWNPSLISREKNPRWSILSLYAYSLYYTASHKNCAIFIDTTWSAVGQTRQISAKTCVCLKSCIPVKLYVAYRTTYYTWNF